jgi:hypothetical protein
MQILIEYYNNEDGDYMRASYFFDFKALFDEIMNNNSEEEFDEDEEEE